MNSIIRKSIALTALAFLFGCGGGGGGSADSGGIGGTGVTSSGVMTKGSVILNGVRFEDTTANIMIDDTPKTAANLQNGMVVQVRGTITQGANGTAQQIEAQIEVRGTAVVTPSGVAARPQTFDVLGQTVIVDDLTFVSGLLNPFDISLNNVLVEVHGLRDTLGRIRATRIEANPGQMGDNTVDEIRGVVSGGAGTNPTTFTLGTQTVIATGATILPTGASYSNGDVVEVHCSPRPCVNGSNQFVASRVEVEEVEDSAFQPGMNQRFEVEGLVSGFTAHPGNFSVAGVPVSTTGSTRFEGGISTDLGNDVKVEAEGVWNGTLLVAGKIEFKRSVVRLQGVVTNSTAPTFTLNIVGAGSVTVEADDFTSGDFAGGAVPPVSATNCVQVRGQRKAGGGVVVTAGEIIAGCSSSQDHLIQAPVEAEVPESTITLLGFAINVSAPTDTPPFQNIDDSPMSRTAFFNAVVPANPGPPAAAGTLVKVRFNTPATTVKQVELED